jgi:hypothetical protein
MKKKHYTATMLLIFLNDSFFKHHIASSLKYKVCYNILLVSLFLLAEHSLLAITIQKYEIAPLNRLTIKFDILPNNIKSSISENKKAISINLGNMNWTDEKQQLNSNGIIKQVNLLREKDETTLILSLTEQRGYSIAKCPYTKTLIIDIFDWNKLDSVEDAYRLGLLSYIDNDYELAKPDLIKGAMGNNAEAAMFLGIIYLNEGKITAAQNSLRYAETKGYQVLAIFVPVKWDVARARVKERARQNGNSPKMIDDWQNIVPNYWKHLVLHMSVPISRLVLNRQIETKIL